jgi:hypothetical protein
MGQPVGVVEKPSSNAGVVRFELNRTLTGMGHERYSATNVPVGGTPGSTLARRLFDTGKVAAVAVYGNMVTVDLARGQTAEGLRSVVESLYTYYVPGFVPPPIEMPAEPAAAAAPAAGGGDAALSAAASRVPAALLERSRLARERWKAKDAG